jgi:hypothetical protein
MLTLGTELTPDGIVCTASDSTPAGIISRVSGSAGRKHWKADPINGPAVKFASLQAAEYYMLAMAIEARI